MSWTDVFPILDDEMVDQYSKLATRKEQRELQSYFQVNKRFNQQDKKHILSVSLFWKNINASEPDLRVSGRAMFMGAIPRPKLLRFDPWFHYAEPLIKGAMRLYATRKDVAVRVYLAADLKFLIPDLVMAGCEVYLMQSSSIRHNPGAMWRFLAFEESDKLVTVLDADRLTEPEKDLQRTEAMAEAGLGFWRVPVWGEQNNIGTINYRPIVGCQMGLRGSLQAQKLMEALIWQTRRGGIATMARMPRCAPISIHGTEWPSYGFDEWFLQTAIYPRVIFDGVLSFIPANARSQLLPLDIEYCMWANGASEMHFFGAPSGSCCPVNQKDTQSPAGVVTILEDSSVVFAKKDKTQSKVRWMTERHHSNLLAHLITTKAEPYMTALASASTAQSKWIVVIANDVIPDVTGAELFQEYRFQECDLVHCGYIFRTIPAEIARWATAIKLDKKFWAEGQLVKLPKLTGPLCLWRSEFLRKFLCFLREKAPGVYPEFALCAIEQMDNAKLANCSSVAQGWKLNTM